MAIKFLDHLNLNNISQLEDTLLHNTTSAGTTDVESKIIYDTGSNTVKYYNGTSWISLTANTNDNDIDYVSNVTFSGGNLSFTGVGNAFNSSVTIDGRYVESVTATASGGITIGGTATDPTVGVTYSGANSIILDATDGTGITVASTDKFLIVDDSDASDTVKYVNFSQLSTALGSYTFDVDADSDGGSTKPYTVDGSDVLDIAGGNKLTTTVAKSGTTVTLTVDHDDTSTLNGVQGSAGISSITVDDAGHVTAVGTATYNNYSHPNHTGHVTSTGDGATVLTVAAITGQTALTSGLASTDELVLSDGGVIKRMDISVLEAYMQANLTFTTDEDTTYDLSVQAGAANTSIIRLAGSDATNDDITISGTADEIAVTESGNTITIGLPDDVIIAGNLTVNGTTTTVNTEEVLVADNILVLNSNETGTPSQAAGLEVERGTEANVQFRWDETDDDWEFQAYDHQGTPALQTYKVPTSYQTTIGNGALTSIAVNHNLGTKNVIVQLWDTSSFDTVFASVVRTTTNQITIDFSSAPATGDVTVLVITAQGQQ